MNPNNFVGYEYHDVTIKRSYAPLYADNYQDFGWEMDSTSAAQEKWDTVTMKFKRDRKICNKVELTRLQKNFEACISEIEALEGSKQTAAQVVALSVGIIGTAFMTGSVFAVTANRIALCILLAVPAFIGWILPYFLYKLVFRKRTKKVEPLIEAKYDELYTACEKGYRLLNHEKTP